MAGQSRDALLLLELVEHLEYAYEDVAQFNSAEELALSCRNRNSAAKEIEQAQECAKKLSDEILAALNVVP